jgi:hypothetical protein
MEEQVALLNGRFVVGLAHQAGYLPVQDLIQLDGGDAPLQVLVLFPEGPIINIISKSGMIKKRVYRKD